MALPAEVAELIIDRCQHRPTLSSCSLVCKAWHTRARFRLFSGPVTVVDVPGVPCVKEFVATFRHPLCTLYPYIHSLSIRPSGLNAAVLNPVIPVLVQLPNLTSLEIIAEHALLSDEALALFRTHFKSIRHLLLRMTFATCADAVGLICTFPLLESLHLHARWIGSSPPLPASLPPSLHTLDLGGFGFLDDVLAWLLLCPPSPAVSSVRLRNVDDHEFGIVFQYVRFVADTLKTFQLSFVDDQTEKNFLDSNFGTIHTPQLRALGVEGWLSDDVTLFVHLLSHFRASHLEEISFTCLIAVNHRRPAWAQLDTLLSSPANPCFRKVVVTTRPHLQRGIEAALPRLHEQHSLDFVFPEGL